MVFFSVGKSNIVLTLTGINGTDGMRIDRPIHCCSSHYGTDNRRKKTKKTIFVLVSSEENASTPAKPNQNRSWGERQNLNVWLDLARRTFSSSFFWWQRQTTNQVREKKDWLEWWTLNVLQVMVNRILEMLSCLFLLGKAMKQGKRKKKGKNV